MGGEKKAFIFLCMLTMVCITVIYGLLFASLWQYQEWIGGSLFALVIVLAVVFVRGRLVEQQLRVVCFKHHEETPLDDQGEPCLWRAGMQANPYRMPVQPSYYQGYRSERVK